MQKSRPTVKGNENLSQMKKIEFKFSGRFTVKCNPKSCQKRKPYYKESCAIFFSTRTWSHQRADKCGPKNDK